MSKLGMRGNLSGILRNDVELDAAVFAAAVFLRVVGDGLLHAEAHAREAIFSMPCVVNHFTTDAARSPESFLLNAALPTLSVWPSMLTFLISVWSFMIFKTAWRISSLSLPLTISALPVLNFT